MGILNVTPDSFSDGGEFIDPDRAMGRVEQMIRDGADMIDVGGESTRPKSGRVPETAELERVIPVVEEIVSRFDIPISVDTTRSRVARAAVSAGAEIINDISGLRFDRLIADVAAETGAGIVLMHSRGDFETMHTIEAVENILDEVTADLIRAVNIAGDSHVAAEQIVLDIGIGFGKTVAQNLELLAKLGKIREEFREYPILVGASRKSFIGKITGRDDPRERLPGSLATAAVAVWNGAAILRVHDVKETAEAIAVVQAIKSQL